MDELEEFSEAPHVVNNCSISSSSRSTISNQPGGNTDGDSSSAKNATAIKANGGGNIYRSNNSNDYSKHNGYTQKNPVMGNGGGGGGVNLMDGGLSDDEDDSEEIVINEFRKQTTQQQYRQQVNGKVMLNGLTDEEEEGTGDEEFTHRSRYHRNNEEDEYEHISLSEDGGGLVGEGRQMRSSRLIGDISTDLLHCDDNDSDLLILTSSGTGKSGQKNNADNFRMFVNS